MNTEMNNSEMKNELLEKIRSGKLEMHSKGYFAFRIGLFALSTILALVVSVLIFTSISFHLRVMGDVELLGFGARGVSFFLAMFPWGLFLTDLVLIMVAVRLVQHFRFGYKHSAVLLLAILLGLTIGMGVALDRRVGFNEKMMIRAEAGHLGPLNIIYERKPLHGPPGGAVCTCEILTIENGVVRAYDIAGSGTPIHIMLPPHFATSSLTEGQIVFIAGDRDGNIIHVFGIKTMMPPPPVR